MHGPTIPPPPGLTRGATSIAIDGKPEDVDSRVKPGQRVEKVLPAKMITLRRSARTTGPDQASAYQLCRSPI
jgi:hypothetical protein